MELLLFNGIKYIAELYFVWLFFLCAKLTVREGLFLVYLDYLYPWEINTFKIIGIYKRMLVAQSCSTLCDPMDCSLPGSFVYGILQARVLEWVAISFSRGSPRPRDGTWSPASQADSLPCVSPVVCFSVKQNWTYFLLNAKGNTLKNQNSIHG